MPRRRTVGLTRTDRTVLDLEREWGQAQHAQSYKLEAAQARLGLSANGYTLILNALLDDPHALAYDSATVLRLREVREQRRLSLSDEPDPTIRPLLDRSPR
mgnify:CR=1 FL=1